METQYKDGSLGKEIKPKSLRDSATPSAKAVMEALKPLSEFYRVNRREVDSIAVDPAMWKRVEKMADDVKDNRIYRHMDGYPVYGKYKLYKRES